ncbi:OmpA family protein [Hydrogenophaga sp.]|uniref:OmpA family protein n=1 Tax=Hydrogenophaga sp. TaxID=1904254 RepID=UPI0027282E58|nr:OmpA family protein [Hydrogenophaga sp.]MDO8904019.1 OmpA family protein [Hydrogenophaga sp.]
MPSQSALVRTLKAVAVLSSLVWMSACAPVSRVILLPQAGGGPSAVVVQTPQAEAVLDVPYGVANVARSGRVGTGTTTAEEVRAQYPLLLAIEPIPPDRFVLEFEPGTSELTQEAQARLEDVMERAGNRPGGEIVVTGHTDRQGSLESNDQLSLERALAVRALFIARGFPPERIEAVGRGEREPLVPTEDEVPEPRNRRAEILVR